MLQIEEVLEVIDYFRQRTDDPIIIYTGYTPDEIESKLNELRRYKNIIVKFGRFIPNQEPHRDDVLGAMLASNNQYAEKIS